MAANVAFVETDTDMRGAERLPVELGAEARHSGTMRVNGVVKDLSMTGFRFESPIFIPTGTVLRLRVEDIRGFEAVVVRAGQGYYGCAFVKPLYPPIYRKLVGQLG